MTTNTSRTRNKLATPWRWSVVSTPIIAALSLYACGAVLDVFEIKAFYVGPIAAFALLGTIVACRKADPGRFATTYAVTVVTGAGGWVTWVSATTVWAMEPFTVLASGLAFFGPLWFLARHTHHHKRLKEREDERRRLEAAEARRWPDLLANLGMPGITQIERIQHGEGCYTLRLQLSSDGKVKFSTLKNKTEEAEIAAGLRYGALYVERGATAAEVQLHVNEIDVLAKTIPYHGTRPR